MDPIILTCGRVRQTFDVPADRAGETCHCPYCGDLHRVPKNPGSWRAPQGRTASLATARSGRTGLAASRNRIQYGLVGSGGFLLGVLVASALSEFNYRPQASLLVLEKLLQSAHKENREAERARSAVESQLATAHIERKEIERERDEARRRVRELQAGVNDAVRRLQQLRP